MTGEPGRAPPRLSHTPAACSCPGENARSWEALGEARPGQSSLSAEALRYRAWAQSWGEGERVLALESREGTRASRRVDEGLSRSLSGGGAGPGSESLETY